MLVQASHPIVYNNVIFHFKMAMPESMQFFQFDSKGNMYIYAPGAGCSGDTKFIAPGDGTYLFKLHAMARERDAHKTSKAIAN